MKMTEKKKPAADIAVTKRPVQESYTEFSERGRRVQGGLSVSNTRPAPANPHREKDPDKDRKR